MSNKTEQESFWQGNFGDDYSKRNSIEKLLPSKVFFFQEILNSLKGLNDCLELGTNIGSNLLAIKKIYPKIRLHGVEINYSAYKKLKSLNLCESLYNTSLLKFKKRNYADLVFTMGVLIHVGPEELNEAYDSIYNTPTSISYRGHSNKLFKRDFAGEMLDRYHKLKLVNYGFNYKRDKNFTLDDTTWFLMEK